MYLPSNSATKIFALTISQPSICRAKFSSVRIRSKKVVMTFPETFLSPFLSSVPFDIALPSENGMLVWRFF